jgi:hypothetical protein
VDPLSLCEGASRVNYKWESVGERVLIPPATATSPSLLLPVDLLSIMVCRSYDFTVEASLPVTTPGKAAAATTASASVYVSRPDMSVSIVKTTGSAKTYKLVEGSSLDLAATVLDPVQKEGSTDMSTRYEWSCSFNFGLCYFSSPRSTLSITAASLGAAIAEIKTARGLLTTGVENGDIMTFTLRVIKTANNPELSCLSQTRVATLEVQLLPLESTMPDVTVSTNCGLNDLSCNYMDPTPADSESAARILLFADVNFAGPCSRLRRYWTLVDFGHSPLNASTPGGYVLSMDNTLTGVPSNTSCQYRSALSMFQPPAPVFTGGQSFRNYNCR